MRRLHLFEFGDQQWFPQLLRDTETAHLTSSVPFLARARAPMGGENLDHPLPGRTDRNCRFVFGLWRRDAQIVEALRKQNYDVRASLTDLYPNPNSGLDPCIRWQLEPVDATHVPPKLTGVRTMFSAFHHFRSDAARMILKDSFDYRRAICIFE